MGKGGRPRSDKCPKCKTKDKEPGRSYCQDCHNTYQSERLETREKLAAAKGFGRGVEAMRKTLADEFTRLGYPVLTCYEVANLIRQSPAPAALDVGLD